MQHQQVVRSRRMSAPSPPPAHKVSMAACIVGPVVGLPAERVASRACLSALKVVHSMPDMATQRTGNGYPLQLQLPPRAARTSDSTHDVDGHSPVPLLRPRIATDPGQSQLRPARKQQLLQVPGSIHSADLSASCRQPFMARTSQHRGDLGSPSSADFAVDSPSPSPSPSQRRHWEATGGISMAAERVHPAPVRTAITVVAPGGGTMANAAAYAELGRTTSFSVEIAGQSRAPYDRYPQSWPQGSAGPNLETFAQELLQQGVIERSNCLVIGSRGGQVVLPYLWRELGDTAAPAVVINGGCSMKLPTAVQWPTKAVTFLLMGGQDYFRGAMAPEEYVADAKSRVPAGNATTAILFVNEMPHMPQTDLLGSVLPRMLETLLAWQMVGPGSPPEAELQAVLSVLARTKGWSGRLLYTQSAGVWREHPFGPHSSVSLQQQRLAARGGA